MRQYDPPAGSGGIGRGSSSGSADQDAEEIRVEIAQTRTEMSGTIDAIQDRLAPEVLAEQAKDIARDATEQAKAAAQDVLQDAVREVKDAAKEVTAHAVHEVKDAARDVTTGAKDAAWDATIGRAEDAVSSAGETAKGVGSTVIDTIKQNPIPAALAALSLYWLYKNRGGSGSSSSTGRMSGTYRTSGGYAGTGTPQAYPIRTGYASEHERQAMMDDAGRMSRSSMARTGYSGQQDDADGGIMSSASQMASNVAGSASQMASSVADTTGEMASTVASTTSHMASSAGETAMDAGSSIIELIQQNPVPAALVGVGLGWLYMNRSSSEPDYRAHSGTHYRYGSQAVGQYNGSRTQDKGSHGLSGTVSRAADQAGEMASSAREQVGEMAGTVQEHVGDMAETVVDQTRRAPGQVQRMIQERPMMAAAIAATLGGVVGLSFPVTQAENQMMGKANEQVMHRAQEVASDTVEKVQEVAQEVRSTATREAKAQGLTT